MTRVALNRDGRLLASAGVDGVIDISDPDGTNMRSIGAGGPIFTVEFDPAADRLAAGGADGAIRIWKVGSVPSGLSKALADDERPNAHVGGVMRLASPER